LLFTNAWEVVVFVPHFVNPTVGYFSLFYFDPLRNKQLSRKRFLSYTI